jgi:hypothetical protein
VYRVNVSYGSVPKRSGHWIDRLPGIDTDLAAMKAKLEAGAGREPRLNVASEAIAAASGRAQPGKALCTHVEPKQFAPGQALALILMIAGDHGVQGVKSVRLRYRHVNQAERWNALRANGEEGTYTAAIPEDYTQSDFALEYYFELEDGRGVSWMYPGFNKTLSNQPYFTVYKKKA